MLISLTLRKGVEYNIKGEESNRDRGLALDANGYIPKPISGAEVLAQVKKLLETNELPPALDEGPSKEISSINRQHLVQDGFRKLG